MQLSVYVRTRQKHRARRPLAPTAAAAILGTARRHGRGRGGALLPQHYPERVAEAQREHDCAGNEERAAATGGRARLMRVQ